LFPTSDESSTYPLQDGNGTSDPFLVTLFNRIQSGLVILDATTTPSTGLISTSGMYIAQCTKNGNKTGAKLIVVRKAPACSCNGSSPNAVQLSCSITYADGTLHPIYATMTWKIGDVVFATYTRPRRRSDYFVFQTTSTITVDNSLQRNFTCTVTFNAPTDIEYEYFATNAPEFNASCSVAVCRLKTNNTTPSPTLTTRPPITIPLPPTTTTTPRRNTTTPSTTKTSQPPSTTTQLPKTTTKMPTTTTLPRRKAIQPPTSTTQILRKPQPTTITSECNCATSAACNPPDKTCSKASECQPDGTNMTGISAEVVVKAELYVRSDKCCPKNLVWGVVVTLRNDSRWLIHDPLCNDDKCQMVVVDASCMSSDWSLLADRKITISAVGAFVQTGNSVENGLNVNDCSESCKRMMNLL